MISFRLDMLAGLSQGWGFQHEEPELFSRAQWDRQERPSLLYTLYRLVRDNGRDEHHGYQGVEDYADSAPAAVDDGTDVDGSDEDNVDGYDDDTNATGSNNDHDIQLDYVKDECNANIDFSGRSFCGLFFGDYQCCHKFNI